jgi:hypothetical protein
MSAQKDSVDDALRPLTCDELIRTELKGKFAAVARYDSMLWKIRSGYVVVLYGALAFLSEKGFVPKEVVSAQWQLFALLLIGGFSVSAFIVDIGFLRAKLRVVSQSDLLYDFAVDLALGKRALRRDLSPNQTSLDADILKSLLHNAGESRKPFDRTVFLRSSLLISFIYIVLPLLMTVVYWRFG